MFCKNRIRKILSGTNLKVFIFILINIIIIGLLGGIGSRKETNSTKEYLKKVSWEKYHENYLKWANEKRSEKSPYGEYPNDAIDYSVINQLELELKGISREKVLQKLYQEVSEKSKSEGETWMNITENVHRTLFAQNFQEPIYGKGQLVTDPIVLLELGNGRCGHSSRLVADIALSNNYKARIVQLASHQVTEIKWQNKWHIIDADGYFGTVPRMPNGLWLSVEDVISNPNFIDYFPPIYWDYVFQDGGPTSNWTTFYNSAVFLGDEFLKNSNYKLIYLYKLPETSNKFYGWNHLVKGVRKIKAVPVKHIPSLGEIKIITFSQGIKVQIFNNVDTDNDIWRHEIYVSTESRGWSYQNQNDIVKSLDPVPYDVGRYFFRDTTEINLKPGKYFLTYFVRDKRAIADPNIFYPPSQEYSFEVK